MHNRLPMLCKGHLSILPFRQTKVLASSCYLQRKQGLTKRYPTPRRILAGSAGGFLVWGGLLPPRPPLGRAPPAVPHSGADAPRVRRARGAGTARGRHGCGGKAGGVRCARRAGAERERRGNGGRAAAARRPRAKLSMPRICA